MARLSRNFCAVTRLGKFKDDLVIVILQPLSSLTLSETTALSVIPSISSISTPVISHIKLVSRPGLPLSPTGPSPKPCLPRSPLGPDLPFLPSSPGLFIYSVFINFSDNLNNRPG